MELKKRTGKIMNNLHENAILVLRFMLEEDMVAPKGMSPVKLQSVVGLSRDDFNGAERFLLQGKLIAGGGGGDNGIRWLTPLGIEYVSEKTKDRLPLSLNAERVLKYVINSIGDNEFLTQPEIIEGTGIDSSKYQDACQQLVDFNFIEDVFKDLGALRSTQLGRQIVHRDFKEQQSVQSIQAGAIFNGPVTGGNIQALASAIGSEIQQNISTLSPEELHKEIEQTLEKLLEQVTANLTLQQKAVYTQLAAEFQKEITKPQPDAGKLHKFLASLGFLSDIGGAIDFSQKTFEVIVKASPYIMMLGQMIVQLLQNSAH